MEMKKNELENIKDLDNKNIQAEYKDLKESEARYRRLIEAGPDITYIYGTKSGAKFWSSQVEDILGITPDTLYKDPYAWTKAIHPDDRAKVKELFESLDKIKTFSIEYRVKDVHGNWHWLNDRSVSVTKSKGEYLIEGLAQDISKRKNIEEALLQSENKYRLIVENANDGIEITQDDHIIYTNARFADILGYGQNEILDITFSDIFTDDAKVELNKRQEQRKSGKDLPKQYQTTFKKKDGSIIDVDVNFQIIEYENKPATFAIIRDISESKEMFRELRKLSTAVDQSPSMIVITDPDGKFEYINSKFSTITGFTSDDIKGQTPRILRSDVLPKETYDTLWETILSGKTWRGEFYNVKKSGKNYWETAAISPIKDENGEIIHFVKVAEDITEWKKIEKALKYSEEQYRLIVENANDGILISQNDEFIYKNAQFIKMLGYKSEEFEKITFKDIYTEQGMKELFERHRKKMAGEELPNKYETTFRKKDGSILFVEITYQLIDYHNTEATFAIVHDITEIKKNEKALKRALEQAKESDHLKSAFLANMSHEIRTPMNGIIGFTNLLKNKKISDEKKDQYLQIIEKSGERLMNIINDLIDISKIEAKQIEVNKMTFNLNEIMDFLYEFFLPECTSKGISLIKEEPDSNILLNTDKDKLEAILINLLKNAIKFTNEGNVTFGFNFDQNKIGFYVKDTGIGIPEEKQKFIFDRFAQVDTSISKPYEGAGLGLSISSAFAEMIGGELKLESTLHEGANFYFSIPYRKRQSSAIVTERPQAPKITSKQDARTKWKRSDRPL